MIGTANSRTIYSFNKALLTNKKQDFKKKEIITKKEIIATINRCKKRGIWNTVLCDVWQRQRCYFHLVQMLD